MKKFLYCCCFVLCLFLFTGCGSKTLKCSKESNNNNEMKMFQSINVSFKNDSVSKLSMNINVQLSENYIDLRDSLIQSIENEFDDFNGEKGISYSTKKKDDGFDFKLDANFNKLSNDVKNDLSIINYESSYDAAKQEFENSGYSCN